MLRLAILVSVAAVLMAGCGGGGGGSEAAEPGSDGSGELGQRADEVEALIADQIAALATVNSESDLVQQLSDAQESARQLSNDIENTEVTPELRPPRAQLALGLRHLQTELGSIRGKVANGDMAGAVERLADLRSAQAIEDAISEIRSLGG